MTQLAKNIGEKAKNLITLREKFLSLVPHFEVVEVSNLFLNWSDVNSKLNNLATKFLNEELSTEKYEVELNNLFKSLEVNSNFIGQLTKRLNDSKFRKVSYRTSALHEDLQSSSFAGQYITFLDQDIE